VPKIVEELTSQLGRSPSLSELATRLDVPVDDLLTALEAGSAYRASSLDAPVGSGEGTVTPLSATLGELDPGMALTEAGQTVTSLLATLPDRERRIVELRFFGELTQAQIAAEMGISQMHVSRLLRRALEQLSARAAADAG
jgi:RNA polymerase sigma-B factor